MARYRELHRHIAINHANQISSFLDIYQLDLPFPILSLWIPLPTCYSHLFTILNQWLDTHSMLPSPSFVEVWVGHRAGGQAAHFSGGRTIWRLGPVGCWLDLQWLPVAGPLSPPVENRTSACVCFFWKYSHCFNTVSVAWAGVLITFIVLCCTFSCTSRTSTRTCHVALLARSLALPYTRPSTLPHVLLHVHTHVILRCRTFSCNSIRTSFYAAARSLARPHARHSTLPHVLLRVHTHVILGCSSLARPYARHSMLHFS